MLDLENLDISTFLSFNKTLIENHYQLEHQNPYLTLSYQQRIEFGLINPYVPRSLDKLRYRG